MPADGQADLAHPEAADWVLGTLVAAGSEEFQQHVTSCGHCQVAVAEFGHVGRILQHLPPAAEPAPDLEARTIASVLDAAAGDRTETHLPRITAASPATAQLASPGSAARIPFAPPQLARYYRASPGTRPRPAPMAEDDRPARAAARGNPAAAKGNPAAVTASQPPPSRRRAARYVSAGAVIAVIVAAIVFSPGFSGSTSAEPPAVNGTGPPVVIPLHATPGTASGQATAERMPGGWSIQLSVHGLTPLAVGEFYECWFAGAGAGDKPGQLALISAGTFSTGRSGAASVSMWSAADPRQFRTMEITAQRPGLASQLGPVILSGVART
jgi:hypothetical protein